MRNVPLDILSAAAAAGDAPPAWMQFLPLVAMVVIFWFLILRPQMRQQKALRLKIESVKKGDQVLTGGGILGKVVRVDESYADVEIAPNVKVRVLKSTITDVVDPKAVPAAND